MPFVAASAAVRAAYTFSPRQPIVHHAETGDLWRHRKTNICESERSKLWPRGRGEAPLLLGGPVSTPVLLKVNHDPVVLR
jgi:hypothetical protein